MEQFTATKKYNQNGSTYKVPSESELLTLIEKVTISESSPKIKPEKFIAFSGHRMLSRQEILILAGASKSGKSGLLYILIALSILKEQMNEDAIIYVLNNTHSRCVLYIDTEMNDWKTYDALKIILKIAGLKNQPEYLKILNLRSQDPTTRYLIIKQALEKYSEQFGGIHMIVIDGVADLNKSLNDEVESYEMVQKIEDLAAKYNCPLIGALHYNPNSDKTRGHLGSHWQRKATTELGISKREGMTMVETKLARNAGEVPTIQMAFDNNVGHHVIVGMLEKTNATTEANTLFRKDLVRMFLSIENPNLTFSVLVEKICEIKGVKESQAKKDIAKLRSEGFLKTITDKGNSFYCLDNNITKDKWEEFAK